jgi:PPOX class probable F420-dependent enzyme
MELSEALSFARDRKQGTLVTIGAKGRPQISNILFVPGPDDTLLISITDDRVKTRNLRRDPRASLYVQGESFWTWVVIEASAALSDVATDPHDATADALVEYYRLGSGEHADWEEYRTAMVSDKRLVLTLHPERAYGLGV